MFVRGFDSSDVTGGALPELCSFPLICPELLLQFIIKSINKTNDRSLEINWFVIDLVFSA